MKVDIRGDVADFAAIDGDLVSQHAWCGNLDRIWPVVIVVAERVGEVKDGILRDERGVLCNIEMGRLNSTLGNRVRHEEEIESALYNFGLLYEAMINIGTLRWVKDVRLMRAWLTSLLKESLSNALVDDDECDMGKSLALSFGVVLVGENFLKLLKLVLDDLLTH